MSRFHPSMSWKDPAEPGQSDSETGPHDAHEMDANSVHDATWSLSDHEESREQWTEEAQHSLDRSSSHFAVHRNYFLPLHYEPNYRYPLVVWLHSDGFNENQVDHVMPHISVRNYIAVGVRGNRAADSIGHRFDWHDSPAAVYAAHEAVAQTIDEASDRFSVHPSRIVLAGYGSGGTMAMRVAMREPQRFAAILSLGGSMPSGRHVWSNLASLRQRRLRMLWLQAAKNPRFDANKLKHDIRLAMMIRAEVEVRQYPTDDEMDTVVLSDVNEWIMRCVISDRSAVSSERWATSPTTYSAN